MGRPATDYVLAVKTGRTALTMHLLLPMYVQIVLCEFVQYFSTKFKCPDVENSTCVSFDTRFENYFSVAAMVPIASMTAVNIWLQSK